MSGKPKRNMDGEDLGKLKDANNSFNVEVIKYHRNCRSRNVHCRLG